MANISRPKQIVIRVNEKEKAKIDRLVEKSGQSQQSFLLHAILNKPIYNTDGLKEVLPELKRIGNNLNQIARSCNEGNQATHDEVKKQSEELNEVWLQLRQFLAKQV